MMHFKMIAIFFLSVSVIRFAFVQLHEETMTRDFSFDNLLPLHTLYYIAAFENISRLQCALQCRIRPSLCRAILFNGNLLSCKLMKTHLAERLVDRGRNDSGWEFWFKYNVCPVDWVPFENHCYYVNKTGVIWNEAKMQCKKHEAYLIEMDNELENTWAVEMFLPPWNAVDCPKWWNCCKCWIGATDVVSEGIFTWTRLTNISFTNWQPNQPDNLHMGHCVRICRNGFWDDAICYRYNTFICEKE